MKLSMLVGDSDLLILMMKVKFYPWMCKATYIYVKIASTTDIARLCFFAPSILLSLATSSVRHDLLIDVTLVKNFVLLILTLKDEFIFSFCV